jgi:hypothetical protein
MRAAALDAYRRIYLQEVPGRGIGIGQFDWYQPCEVDPTEALPIELIESAIRGSRLRSGPAALPGGAARVGFGRASDRWTIEYDVAAGTLYGTIEGTLDGVTLSGVQVRERRAVRTR